METAKKVYGIDLGTTYSVITTLDDNGMPEVIDNYCDGTDFLPSAVWFQDGSDPVVGKEAKKMKVSEPDRVVEFIKRYIGKPDAPKYQFNGEEYDPIKISALILKRMKAYADEQGHNVQDVVITCPAYFGNEEKMATRQAGELAGLNVLNIVHEPTAAALNYCSREFKENRKVMVYDLGGGTFDITLFDFCVDEQGKSLLDVIKTGGDDRLGGIDWDSRLFDLMCQKYVDHEEVSIELSDMDDDLKSIIRAEVEEVKQSLSQLNKKSVKIVYDGTRIPIEVTRQEFEECSQDLVIRTMSFVHSLLSDVHLSADDVDLVLLVGGSTLMPMIKNAVEALFPNKVRVEQPHLAVAKGAALSAACEYNERLLNIQEKITQGKTISQEEKEALGVAADKPITADSISHLMINVPQQVSTVKDKLTRSLGPMVFDGTRNDLVIENLLFVGDEIPAEAEETYTPYEDNQPQIQLCVYENVSEDRVNNRLISPIGKDKKERYTDPALKVKLIGELILPLPPNTPKTTRIRVAFRSSTVGLEVTATNVETGESVQTVIQSDLLYSEEKLQEVKSRFASIQTVGEI